MRDEKDEQRTNVFSSIRQQCLTAVFALFIHSPLSIPPQAPQRRSRFAKQHPFPVVCTTAHTGSTFFNMQTLAARRAAPFTSAGVASRRPAAAPRPSLARSGLKLRDAAAMQQRAVSDAALADIADLESRSTSDQAGPAGGLPILPSEQVRVQWCFCARCACFCAHCWIDVWWC